MLAQQLEVCLGVLVAGERLGDRDGVLEAQVGRHPLTLAALGMISHNGQMMRGIFELAFVLGLAGLLVFGAIQLLSRPENRRLSRPEDRRLPSSTEGHWVTAHYDVEATTRVVVQKVSPTGIDVLDEHVVATLRIEDPEYDAQFLSSMATARERRALFESEAG